MNDTSHTLSDTSDRARIAKHHFSLRVATDRDTASIDDLRMQAYRHAGYFSLPDPETVRRRTDDPQAICLVLSSNRALAATVRLTPVANRAQAEAVLEGRVDLPEASFPSLTLCRGATNDHFRGLGLMSYLVSLGVAVAHAAQLHSALGVQFEGTPHFRAMHRAGWLQKPIEDQMHTVSGNASLNLVYLQRDSVSNSVRHSQDAHHLLHESTQPDSVIDSIARRIRR